MSVKTDDREEKIMRLLLQRGSATIEELLGTAETSAPSIRRDLNRLERRGLVRVVMCLSDFSCADCMREKRSQRGLGA